MRDPASAGGAGEVLRRARFDARMWLGRKPVGFHMISWWNWSRVRDPHALVTRRTQLVMDGFPSSGNSFAIAALKAACAAEASELPRVAHHLHNPGQVRAAVRLGLPTLLLVRDPRATTVSALTRWPSLTAGQVLQNYLRYHERLRDCWGDVVVADFAAVTSDFGAVIRRVNGRFGSRFPEFQHTPENASAVYDSDDAGRVERRKAAEEQRDVLSRPDLAGPLDAATSVYGELLALANAPGG